MTDTEMLLEKIRDSGMTMKAVSEKSGINRANIYNKLKGRGEFTASEIVALSETLRLTKPERDKIFLSATVS